MASATTPTFMAEITGEDFGIEIISFTWAPMSPIINKMLRVDLDAGSNVVDFELSDIDSKARMLIIFPPTDNTESITLSTGGIPISRTDPTPITLDQVAGVTSVTLVAGGDIKGVRLIIL